MFKYCVVCTRYEKIIQTGKYKDWCFSCANKSIKFKERIRKKLEEKRANTSIS